MTLLRHVLHNYSQFSAMFFIGLMRICKF